MVSFFNDEKGWSAVLQDAQEKSIACAYIWGNERDPDLYGEWDFEV
jgi:hypothetical protein